MTYKDLEQLYWKDAEPLLRAVNAPLVEALLPLAKLLNKKKQDFVFRASYPYGAKAIDKGHFKPPGNGTWADQSNASVPVCVVLNNAFEIINDLDIARGTARSLRVIGKGDLFGVFESCNSRLGIPKSTEEQWSVTAGTTSTKLIFPMGNEQLRTNLVRVLSPRWPGVRQAAASSVWFFEDNNERVVQLLAPDDANEWHAELILLPGQWDADNRPEAAALRQLISDVAWVQSKPQRASAMRPDTLMRWLRDTTIANWKIGEAAIISFLNHVQAVAGGDSVAYRPLSSGEHIPPITSGPFDIVSTRFQQIVHEARLRAKHKIVFLVPCHLTTPGDAGWLSLSRPMDPRMFPDGVRSRKSIIEPFATRIDDGDSQLRDILPDLDFNAVRAFCEFSKSKTRSEVLRPLVDIETQCRDFSALPGQLFTKRGFFQASLRLVRRSQG